MIKNILILGASSDIGFAITKQIYELEIDAWFGLHYNSNDEKIKELKKIVNPVFIFKEDFSKTSSIMDEFFKNFDNINILINCVGVISDIPFDKITEKEYDRIMNINAKTPFFIIKEAFNNMKKNGGKIINISSNITKFGMGRNSSIQYAASKSILDTLTIGLANLGAKYNILVNSISPGFINTKLQTNRPDYDKRIKMIPLQRAGTIDDIANMVTYLVSDKGNFITGQNIRIAGGE